MSEDCHDITKPAVPIKERTAEKCKKCNELAKLLLEARDALPAISITSARLRNIDLTLADRIETALEPWRIKDENPTS